MALVAMSEMTRARLMTFGSLLMILALFGLDLRDLYYKLHMLGPYDTYSFRTVGYDTLQTHPIPKPADTIAMLANGSASAASGWPSFYSRCESMYASGSDASRFFLTTLAKNCSVNLSTNETRVMPQILLTASMRVDSMVAVSCDLLFMGRRPSICQDAMAIGFQDRYQLEEDTPTFDDLAQPGSDEEAELLRFLDMVSFSYPMTHVTCAEAFVLGEGQTGVFRSSVYACSSPNLYRSEWIGFAHPVVAKFLVTKGWLTADVISFMGIRYGIRQNSIDIYDVSYSTTGKMQLASSSLVNFSSFGHLYAISVLIDIVLLVAHVLSTFEVLKWIMLPQYQELQAWIQDFEDASKAEVSAPQSMRKKGFMRMFQSTIGAKYAAPPSPDANPAHRNKPLVHAATDGGAVVFEEVQFYSFFSRSFYRNQHYVLLTTITQVLAWIIILPNSVVWTWSDSLIQQLQGYLCSIKCWVLIASAINLLWSVLVKINEKRAYRFVRGTYLTNPEIIVIGAIVSFIGRQNIFSISGTKYAYEEQRHFDFSSFTDGYLGYSNSYDKRQDYLTTTSLHVAWIIYKPLVYIILFSILVSAGYLMVKYAFFYFAEREGRDMILRWLGRPARAKAAAVHVANDSIELTSSDSTSPSSEYCRLPLEEALGCPIRAISLVRNTLSMEIVKDGKTYIRPSCYLDFGVMLKNGQIETRVGFNDIFKTSMPIRQGSSVIIQDSMSALATVNSPHSPTLADPPLNDPASVGVDHFEYSKQTPSIEPPSDGGSAMRHSRTRLPPLVSPASPQG